MQAVILAGGKQYFVKTDDIIEIDLNGEAKKLEFEALMVIDGATVSVGAPIVKGATVAAERLAEVKGDKIKVLRFKAKKRIKRLTGHRQRYAQVKITSITV